jgi:hypothetical protein
VSTHTSETITRTIRRWIIPAAEPWGACIGDISAASADACRVHREVRGLAAGAQLPDDALRFHIGDNEIVISFETEEPAS